MIILYQDIKCSYEDHGIEYGKPKYIYIEGRQAGRLLSLQFGCKIPRMKTRYLLCSHYEYIKNRQHYGEIRRQRATRYAEHLKSSGFHVGVHTKLCRKERVPLLYPYLR